MLTESGWETSKGADWKNPGFPQSEEDPVSGVSWDEPQEFCNWLTVVEQRLGLLRADQRYRLPTDWEWSVAARG